MSESATRLGVSGRISQIFLHSQMTPLIALIALLLGAVRGAGDAARGRAADQRHHGERADPVPGRVGEDVESLVTAPAEQVLSRITGLEHIYSVTQARHGGAHGAVQGRRGPHRRRWCGCTTPSIRTGTGCRPARRGRAHHQADGHRRRAHRQPDAVDGRSGARRLPAGADRARGRDRAAARARRAHRGDHRRRAARAAGAARCGAPARLALTPQDVRVRADRRQRCHALGQPGGRQSRNPDRNRPVPRFGERREAPGRRRPVDPGRPILLEDVARGAGRSGTPSRITSGTATASGRQRQGAPASSRR